jgi:mRNA-degrading endonuclease toxin of MazEF toxin-antitoxin module
MATQQPRRLVRGLIVWADIPDPAGRNPKKRPVVLLTSEDEVPTGDPLVAVGITGTLPNPLPPDYVLLPWHRSGHPYTGLKKKSAAWCRWVATVPLTADLEVMGRVPDRAFEAIAAQVRAIHEAQLAAEADSPTGPDAPDDAQPPA